ncbi:response regulator [Delftia sp. PS-11]|uniref:response regulator n=1 Tax=Delftia sp. PS-11 TaxID=2767222 RepID=UPI002455EDC4|nr:response regulator [Delftia sp. PS-11]KAJ8743715.1 response regulator [Delftia sp. PS-11]
MAHILIVEDDEQFRQMLASMLAADQHRVSQAGNGFQGLEAAGRGHPDLIITDILMPEMDGIDFVMALKRQCPHVPVIAMSGGRRSISAEFNLNSASLMGVAAILTKPFKRDDLRLAVRQALERA